LPITTTTRGGGFYGSLAPDPAPRIAALAGTVLGLHHSLSAAQGLLDGRRRQVVPTNSAIAQQVDVVICTTGEHHLLDKQAEISHLFRHHRTSAAPMLLGFECHDVLRRGLGDYDYFVYLEDDIQLADPYFLRKLQWFSSVFGDEVLLQPNRYELHPRQPLVKLYIDGNLADPALGERIQHVGEQPRLESQFLGDSLVFSRVNNPHSGCFFLNRNQMKRWAGKPYFLDRDTSFAGPLESAATLGVAKTFRICKPVRENAAFLEVRHQGNRYLGVRVKLDLDA
jgi:hypothetical protein